MVFAHVVPKSECNEVCVSTYHFYNGEWKLVLPEHFARPNRATSIPDYIDDFFANALEFLDS